MNAEKRKFRDAAMNELYQQSKRDTESYLWFIIGAVALLVLVVATI